MWIAGQQKAGKQGRDDSIKQLVYIPTLFSCSLSICYPYIFNVFS